MVAFESRAVGEAFKGLESKGLKIIGRKRLVIENVVVDIKDDESDECVKQLLVTQYDKPLTK